MRFATWEHEGSVHSGVVGERGLYPFADQVSILDIVKLGLPQALEMGNAALDNTPTATDDVRLLPPLEPPTMRDFAAFEEHVAGVTMSVPGESSVPPAWYRLPVFYFSNPYSVIGAHDVVPIPAGCHALDFELELAAVIGKDGASISPEEANDHVFGYTIYNDWSARDLQKEEMTVGLGPAKGKDFATTLGPYLVTADEIDLHRDRDGFLDLGASVSLNGATIGSDNFRNMSWSFDSLVAHASRGTQVRAGDVIGSGTCGNGGCLAELWGQSGEQSPVPLAPGDVVEMTIEAVGTIRNVVVEGLPSPEIPEARRRDWTQNRNR